jgi:hypothetical protein
MSERCGRKRKKTNKCIKILMSANEAKKTKMIQGQKLVLYACIKINIFYGKGWGAQILDQNLRRHRVEV